MTIPRYVGAALLVMLLIAIATYFPVVAVSDADSNVWTCGTITYQGTVDEARSFEEESGLTCEGERRYIPAYCGYEVNETCPIRFPNLG